MPLRLSLIAVLLIAGLAVPVVANTPAAPIPERHPTYELEVEFDAEASTIGGLLQLDWVNATGTTQQSLPFRLYPNGKHYGDGSIIVNSARVDGMPVTPSIADDPTVMTVQLGDAVGPNERVRVDLAFETAIPVDLSGSFGILQHLPEPNWWALADWYPVIAGWEADESWYLDPPTSFGDPTFASTTANYSMSVEHPAELLLTGSGDEVVSPSDRDGYATTTFSETRLREFAMVAMPAADVTASSFDVDGQSVTITLPTACHSRACSPLLKHAPGPRCRCTPTGLDCPATSNSISPR